MKWIKASERLPEPNTYYFLKTPFGFATGKYTNKIFLTSIGDRINPIDAEWLDETESTPTHGRTAEEIKKIMDLFTDEQCLKGSEIIGGASHLSPESQIHQFRQLMEDGFYRQTNISGSSWFKLYDYAAMHDFRNQLHQVREVSAEDISNAAVAYSLMHADVADRLKKYLVEVVFVDGAKWMQSHPVNTGDGCKYYQVDFGADLRANLKVSDCKIEVIDAINGWGWNVTPHDILIEEYQPLPL